MSHPPSGPITFLLTDIESSTRMTAALGSATYRERLKQPHDELVKAAVDKHHGHLFNDTGDGYFIAFQNAHEGLACAVEIQRSLTEAQLTATDKDGREWRLRVRMGLHTATEQVLPDPDGNYHHGEVNLAARVQSLAAAEQVIVSESCWNAAYGKEQYEWQEWSNRYLKSFEDAPMTVHELLWDGVTRGEPGARWLPEWFGRELNRFIGRTGLLEEIRGWLRGRKPLLTLHGPGGIGKTHLAVETVVSVSGLFSGGVAFIALDREAWAHPSQVAPEQLASAIARGIDAPPQVLQQPETQLAPFLKTRGPMLVVLDNWESVDNRATLGFLSRLVQGAPSIRWLVTGRVKMGLTTVGNSKAIPPMEIPAEEAHDPERLESYQLFLERVRQRAEDHPLDDQASIVRILRATDGFALGIELAAAQVVHYPLLSRIADGLEQSRLDWQRTREELGDLHPGPERHATMEACIHWSVRLLPPEQQAAFCRLAVFPYDFSAEAAEAVCGVSDDWLRIWCRAALLEQQTSGRRERFSLLPIVREYALRQLGSQRDDLERRFVAHFREFSRKGKLLEPQHARDQALQQLGPSAPLEQVNRAAHQAMLQALNALDAERANCSRAATISCETGDLAAALSLYDGLARLFQLRSYWSDSTTCLRQVLTLSNCGPGSPTPEGKRLKSAVLNNLGLVYQAQGRWREAEAAYQESLTILREFGDRVNEGKIINNLGNVYQAQGRWEEAEAAFLESLAICREFGDRLGEGQTLNNLGLVFQAQGRWPEAEAAHQESLTILREFGDRLGEGRTLENLALLRAGQGDWAGALELERQALQILETTQDERAKEQARGMIVYLEAALAGEATAASAGASVEDDPAGSGP